jgi:hypothetical protein
MTIQYADSFGAYGAMADLQKAGYSSSGLGSYNINATAGRRSNKAVRGSFASSPAPLQRPVDTAAARIAVAVAFRISDISQALDTEGTFLTLGDGTVTHIGVSVLTTGAVRVYRGTGGGATTLGTSAAALISSNTYYHLEVEALIDESGGAVKVYLDGNSTPILDLSAIDTNNGGDNEIALLGFGADRAGSVVFDFCDLVVRDGASQLGDVRVDYLPASGNGNTNQFATQGSSTAYENVDETTPNDADFNYSSTPGQIDQYALTGVSWSPSNIYAVVEKVRARKSDAGTRSIQHVMRSGSTDYQGATRSLTTSHAYYHHVREVDPNTTAAWGEVGVNAAQVGVAVV